MGQFKSILSQLTPILWHLSHLFSTHIKWTQLRYPMLLKQYSALARHDDFPAHSRGTLRHKESHISLSTCLTCRIRNTSDAKWACTLHGVVYILGAAWASTDETRLVKTLFTGYNKVVRPVTHFKDPVVVTVGLQLIQLISVVRSHVARDISPSVLRFTVISCLNTFLCVHRMRSTRLSAATCDWNRFGRCSDLSM